MNDTVNTINTDKDDEIKFLQRKVKMLEKKNKEQ